MLKPSSKKLKNGIHIICAPNMKMPSASIRLYALGGSRAESKSNNGITHILEHLFASKIKERLTQLYDKSWSSSHIFKGFDAYTSHEFMEFSFDVHKDEAEAVLEILVEAIKNPDFTNKDFLREKKIIFSEIEENKDDFYKELGQKIRKAYFGNNSLALPIIGTVSNVASANIKQTQDYFEARFHPQNLYIVLTGGISGAKQKFAEKLFSQLKSDQSIKAKFFENFSGSSKAISLKNKHAKQAYYNLFYTIPITNYRQRIKWRFTGDILHDYFNEYIRERKGTVYSIDVLMEHFQEFIILAIEFNSSGNKFDKISNLIDKLLKNFSREFNNKVLISSKQTYLKEMELDWSYPSSVANELGQQVVLNQGKVVDATEEKKIIENISKEEVVAIVTNLAKEKRFVHITKA